MTCRVQDCVTVHSWIVSIHAFDNRARDLDKKSKFLKRSMQELTEARQISDQVTDGQDKKRAEPWRTPGLNVPPGWDRIVDGIG